MEVLVHMDGFSVCTSCRVLFGHGENWSAQEGNRAIVLWIFCGKLDVRVNGINVLEELITKFTCWMTKVSSIYLIQSLGVLGTVLVVLDSNSSMNKLAIRGLMGDPKPAPCTCSKYLP